MYPKIKKIFRFGEYADGYSVPVLNEREIRAAAGILFVLMLISVMTALGGDFLLMKYTISVFFADILIRLINPAFSPSLIIGRLIVRNQNPEYVSAAPKKFAWIIGAALGAVTFTHIVIVNAYSPVSGIICFVCLIFLFFESAFGICLGCKFYPLFFKNKPEYCSGGICESKAEKEIQKVSMVQLAAVLFFISGIIAAAYLLRDTFDVPPYNLFGI
jgi:hypothetical protein